MDGRFEPREAAAADPLEPWIPGIARSQVAVAHRPTKPPFMHLMPDRTGHPGRGLIARRGPFRGTIVEAEQLWIGKTSCSFPTTNTRYSDKPP